ncbi:MAG TPA: HEAT repeat domain-containing protein, partial [Rhodothermales bacterium]|nr:HEAT repeat domain-containing protein [Rhodothermales bacterium]
ALARPGNDTAVPDLRRLALEHSSVAVREAAIGGLARIGTERSQEAMVELIGGLLERAANRDSVSALVASGALQQAARRESNVLIPFVERYYRDSRLAQNVRWSLLMTLRMAGTAEARTVLWRVAQDRDMPVRQRSEVLQWLAPSFTAEDVTRVGTMLRSEPDVAMREALVRSLSALVGGSPWFGSYISVPGQFGYMDAADRTEVLSVAGTEALVTTPAPPVEEAKTLTEAREEVRERQARREQLASQALQILVEVLRTEQETRVQRAIVRAIGAAGYDVGTDALRRFAISNGAEESVRSEALDALGRIGTEEAYEALRSSLASLDTPRLLTAALRALVSSTAYRVRSDAIPDFVRLTSHVDLSVRRAAVDALGRLDAPQARQALLDLIRTSGR